MNTPPVPCGMDIMAYNREAGLKLQLLVHLVDATGVART